MRLADLGIDSRITDILARQGIDELYPPQAEALEHVLAGESLVLAAPTASGKSLVAYIGILRKVLEGRKALYIVPLRALAAEKYDELKEYESLGLRVGRSVGDFDSPGPELKRYDILVATSERADSLMRHRTDWLDDMGIVVADEVHLIDDPSRGPTMEVTLIRLMETCPDLQILALSATINNSVEIAEWLGARHVRSDWRPVELRQGVYLGGRIRFTDGTTRPVDDRGDDVVSLVTDTVQEGGQALIFVNSRRSSESVAERLAGVIGPMLDKDELADLDELAGRIDRGDEATSLGARLARCLRGGTAFHNAGLTDAHRRLVEAHFRGRQIRCIAATPTLAAGINLPARRVIVRDTRRFDPSYGPVPVPVLEIKQMCGRAGRPQFDPYGEAVLVAKGRNAARELADRYLLGGPDSIRSKLGAEPALRSHLLAAVATGYASSRQDIMGFIDRSFFAHQMDVWTIEDMVDRTIEFLEESELMASDGETLRATMFGRRTSDLYIDPLSAVMLRQAVDRSGGGETGNLEILHAVCSTPDMYPLYLRKGDYDWLLPLAGELEGRLLLRPEDYADSEMLLSALKTASLLLDWIDECPEKQMEKKYGVGPGDIRRQVETANWLLYSMGELARLFASPLAGIIRPMLARMQYGIREELLPLAELEGVGRRRARALFDAGYRDHATLAQAGLKELMDIPGIGPQLAASIREQARKRRAGL